LHLYISITAKARPNILPNSANLFFHSQSTWLLSLVYIAEIKQKVKFYFGSESILRSISWH